MNRQDNQEQRRDFEFYMGLDPEKSVYFLNSKIASLETSILIDLGQACMNAQRLELLRNKMQHS